MFNKATSKTLSLFSKNTPIKIQIQNKIYNLQTQHL